MSEHSPLLGRCKQCDFALFATRDQVLDAAEWRDVKQTAMPYRVGNWGFYARCPQRHKVFPLKAIKGTYSKDHKCDSRCLNAKGWKCTCSCGGANHGRGYAVVIHEAGVTVEDQATEKQIAFIERLMDERVLTDEQAASAREKLALRLTKKQASAWIERLLELPKVEDEPVRYKTSAEITEEFVAKHGGPYSWAAAYLWGD